MLVDAKQAVLQVCKVITIKKQTKIDLKHA